ncbi:MAG: MFS transporter [Candidatus Bathyarchaeota archaeon]|nr:MFS transporter [Candidatus Bathyarchaeota archaeon]
MEELVNISESSPNIKKCSPGRLFLPSLIISSFAVMPPGILIGLLLIDIALTFNVSVGIAGQINTFSSIVAVIFALFMGVLSVRFKHKSLLIMGLLFVSISALGCSLASSFSFVLISYSLTGLATAMVMPMAFALIGEHLPLEKRANAVGWTTAGASLSYAIGAPVIGLIADSGGWRFAFLGFAMPIAIASLLLAFIALQFTSPKYQTSPSNATYFEGFKRILSSKSATACLAGNVLRMASFMAILLYGTSFFRERFLISTGSASIVLLGSALFYTLGSLISGRLANAFGSKLVVVLTALPAGLFTISFTYLPNFWLSLTLNYLGACFFGTAASASISLTLEQVPNFRGSMMSINSAAQSLGSTLGAAIGGLALDLYGYEVLGSILGAIGIFAAIIFFFLAIDPTRTPRLRLGA